jgi:hypothetical protein
LYQKGNNLKRFKKGIFKKCKIVNWTPFEPFSLGLFLKVDKVNPVFREGEGEEKGDFPDPYPDLFVSSPLLRIIHS